MIRAAPTCLAALLVALLAGTPASAAERTVAIGTVDRVRIDGLFTVTIRTGAPPSLTITGERRAIEDVDARADGGVLAIRARGDGGRPSFAPATGRTGPILVTIATPALKGVTLVGGAAVTVGAMKAAAIDLSVSGTGTLSVASVDADRLGVTLIGNGAVTLAGGRTGFARLVGNGGGGIDAAAVDAADLVVHLDGVGAVKARSRYTAQVVSGGLGSVTVAGAPKCTVKGSGVVACGAR